MTYTSQVICFVQSHHLNTVPHCAWSLYVLSPHVSRIDADDLPPRYVEEIDIVNVENVAL